MKNLADLDSRSVPLPHGTEVVTRVDRLVGERRVPQGTVGREGVEIDYTSNELSHALAGILASLFARLDVARSNSPLPETAQNTDEVRAWLLAIRRARFTLPS